MTGNVRWPAVGDKAKLREMLAEAAAATALLPIRAGAKKDQRSARRSIDSRKGTNAARRGR